MNIRRISVLALALVMIFTVCASTIVPFSTAAPDETEGVSLVNLQSTWKYLDNGTDPAGTGSRTSWTEVDFDDSAWKTSSGDATFGAKAGALTALDSAGVYLPKILLNQYLSDGKCVPTYFFRTSFTLDSLPAEGLALTGTVLYDDAVIIYINGTRVAAFGEPDGGYATNLSYGGTGAWDPLTDTFALSAECLKTGKNVIAVELHNQRADSSDIYFEMSELTLGVGTPQSLTMNVGADETQRNFTWYFPAATGCVQYAVRNGDTFPETYSSAASVTTVHGDTYIHRATITNLKPNTEYVYRIVNDSIVSKNYYFETDGTDSFNFFFVGDPQIGASWGEKDDASNWASTLNLAKEMFPDTSFIISAGDQVETCTSEDNYRGFLAPDTLKSLALATTVGNHDTQASLYSEHFNNPNTEINGKNYGSTDAGCDYWYTYNNTLFMHLNANNMSVAEHNAFMEYAIAANPNVTWKVVILHFALFGAGPYYEASVISDRRVQYAPLFEKLDIDVVLAGHEHVYGRSYMMNEVFNPDTANGVQSSVTNPEGILYITGPSSSGSKYYDLLDEASTPHIAVRAKNITAFTNIEVSETSFKLTVYNVEDKSVIDSFEIIKTPLSYEKTYDVSYSNVPTGGDGTSYAAKLTDGIAAETFDMSDDSWFMFHEGKNAKDGMGSVTVDLGGVYDITKVNLHLANVSAMKVKAPEAIAIYSSLDNETFDFIGNVTIDNSADAIYWAGVTADTQARYIKAEFTLDGKYAYINEIEVYEKHTYVLPEDAEPNLANNKDYTISVTNKPLAEAEWETDYSANLTDGKADKVFNSGDASWFILANGYNAADGVGTVTVDLDGTCEINKVRLHLCNVSYMSVSAPSSINVYTSSDGIEYTKIGEMPIEEGINSIYWSNLELDSSVTASSVKFEFILNGKYAYLNEVEVHGVRITDSESDTDTDKNNPNLPVEDEYVIGDINDNGSVDMTDYILAKRAYFGTYTLNEGELKRGDVNESGNMDMTDYILIKRVYFGTYSFI